MAFVRISLFTVFVSVFCFGCSPKKEIIVRESNTENTILDTPRAMDIVELVFRYSTTKCLGDCKVFTLEVLSNGTVTYIGTENVKKIGVYQAFEKVDIINGLLNIAGDIKFLSFKNEYPTNGEFLKDLPIRSFYLKVGEEEKNITVNHNIPNDLKKFEIHIEQLIDNVNWVKADR